MAAVPAPRSGPRSGDVVFIGRAASVQFAGASAFNFRIIRVEDQPTYEGWLWLDGYQLGANGDAIERRRIFVLAAGLGPVGQQSTRQQPTRQQRIPRRPG